MSTQEQRAALSKCQRYGPNKLPAQSLLKRLSLRPTKDCHSDDRSKNTMVATKGRSGSTTRAVIKIGKNRKTFSRKAVNTLDDEIKP